MRKPNKEEYDIIMEYGLDPGCYGVLSSGDGELIVCSRSDDRNIHVIRVQDNKPINRRPNR